MKRKSFTKIMGYKLATTLIALFIVSLTAYSQVTVGSDNIPQKAALLDIKTQNPDASNVTSNKGGILLPRVKLQRLNSLLPFIPDAELTTEATRHTGLVVYNVTPVPAQNIVKGVYTWDGSEWKRSEDTPTIINSDNGVTWDGTHMHLGGTLNKSVTVNQGTNNMNFTAGTGKFIVNTSSLVVSGSNVGIGITTPSYPLHLVGNSYMNGYLGVGTTPSTSYRLNVSGTSRLYGNVGINGAPLSSTQLYVSGISRIGGTSSATANTSAQLELADTNKGLLLNRVRLITSTDKVTVPNPVEGMMVYNERSTETLSTGVHYWNGTQWMKMVVEIPKNELKGLDLMENTTSQWAHYTTTETGTPLPIGTKNPSTNKYEIVIPEDGSYAFSFRLYGVMTVPQNTTNGVNRGVFYLNVMRDNIVADAAEINIPCNPSGTIKHHSFSTYSLTLGCTAKAGEKITFRFGHLYNKGYPGYDLDEPVSFQLYANPTQEGKVNANRTSMIWWKL